MTWLAVGIGAAFGAWARWGLGLWMNGWLAQLPMGTLLANLSGAYLIGIAVAFFGGHPAVPDAWRLFAITGFLGGLTTFSTFSAEAMIMLQRGEYAWMAAHSALHLGGSILLCIAGFATLRSLST
jgi:fluoride exporter